MKYIVIVMAVLLSGCAADLKKKCIVQTKVAQYIIRVRNPDQSNDSGTTLYVTREEFDSLEIGSEYKASKE